MTPMFDMLPATLDAEYKLFLFALAGRYQSIKGPGVELTPRALIDLEVDAYGFGRTFMASVRGALDAATDILTSDLSDEAQSNIVTRKKELEARLRGIVVENVRQTLRMAKTGIGGVVDMLKSVDGASGLLVQRLAGNPTFTARDSAGRKWEAKRLVHFLVRDFAYQGTLDRQVAELESAGHDIVQTTYGQTLSLRGTDGYESFDHVRATYFHPNSSNLLVTSDVST